MMNNPELLRSIMQAHPGIRVVRVPSGPLLLWGWDTRKAPAAGPQLDALAWALHVHASPFNTKPLFTSINAACAPPPCCHPGRS